MLDLHFDDVRVGSEREYEPAFDQSSAADQKYLVDFSLALINRTGAYHIGRDLLDALPEIFHGARYWRWRAPPRSPVLRKIAGRLMLKEMQLLGDSAAAARSRPDLPTFFLDPLYVLRTPLERCDIVLCHDLGPITHPELFEPATVRLYHRAYEKIAAIGPGVITVSAHSASEYRKLYGLGARFLTPVPLYVRGGAAAQSVAPVENVRGPFLLTVAALEKRKNHLRIIEAYRQSGLYERGISYVFCGPRGNSAAAVTAAAQATPGVIQLGYVSDAQLRWLFGNAAGMVLPSLLEGFGMPPLEAAQAGLVSIIDKGGAQEEALAGAAIMVDPTDTEAIAAGMRAVLALALHERAAMLATVQARAAQLSRERFIEGFRQVLARNAPPEVQRRVA